MRTAPKNKLETTVDLWMSVYNYASSLPGHMTTTLSCLTVAVVLVVVVCCLYLFLTRGGLPGLWQLVFLSPELPFAPHLVALASTLLLECEGEREPLG